MSRTSSTNEAQGLRRELLQPSRACCHYCNEYMPDVERDETAREYCSEWCEFVDGLESGERVLAAAHWHLQQMPNGALGSPQFYAHCRAVDACYAIDDILKQQFRRETPEY